MTSGQLQIHSLHLLWLLTTVSIVRVVSMPLTDTNPSSTSLFSLIIQRPRFAGGLLKIPLDFTVQLIQSSTKDIARNIIRLRYSPTGKRLVVRTANASERKQWIAALSNSLATVPKSATHRTPKTVDVSTNLSNTVSCYPVTAQVGWKSVDRASVPTLPLYSLDAIKRFADGYDNLAQQWAQVATETRQFHAEINGLQPPCVASQRAAIYCTAY